MGNITELSQGSLNGLRRQLNECIENAYNKGYKDGKNEPNEEHEGYIRNLVNEAKQEGYDIGLEIGKKQAISELPEVANKENEMYNDGYNKGYNSAINDYNAMYEWLHDCFVDFEKFLLEKGFYTDEKFSDGFVVGQLMYDLICDHDIAEVIAEFKKWQEQKKQAEEEIKVGDEVKDLATDNIGVVMAIGNLILYITNNGVYSNTLGSLEKTGRHFDEVGQLLDKLKGDKE